MLVLVLVLVLALLQPLLLPALLSPLLPLLQNPDPLTTSTLQSSLNAITSLGKCKRQGRHPPHRPRLPTVGS
jgi:hypothetical protein